MAPQYLLYTTLPNVEHTLLKKSQPKASVLQPTYGPLQLLPQTKALAARPVVPPAVARKVEARRQARRVIAGHGSGMAHLHSRNWSGAVVPATGGERFSLITASWEVPDVAHPAGLEHSYVSVWIGLGGSYRASRSMPQMGSEHGWDGVEKKPIHRLWCQWWLGAGDSGGYLSHYIDEALAPLQAGDRITCWLEVDAAAMNVTYHWQWTRKSDGFTKEFSATDSRGVPVIADSADWIVERPTEVITNADKPGGYELGRHHPLPVFLSKPPAEPKSGEIAITMNDCLAWLGQARTSDAARLPFQGQLLSLRETVPGTSRSYVELEPTVASNPRDAVLHVVRHLP